MFESVYHQNEDELNRLATMAPLGYWNKSRPPPPPTKNLLANMHLARASADSLLALNRLETLVDSGDFPIAIEAAKISNQILKQSDWMSLMERELDPDAVEDMQNRWLKRAMDADTWLALRTLSLEVAVELSEMIGKPFVWEPFFEKNDSLSLAALEIMDDESFTKWLPSIIKNNETKTRLREIICNRSPFIVQNALRDTSDLPLKASDCLRLPLRQK